MTRIILMITLMVSSSAFAASTASDFVQDVVTQGEQILSLKSTTEVDTQLCALVSSIADTESMGMTFLGDYANLKTDQAGVKLFLKLVPSVAVSKLIKAVGKKAAGSTIMVGSDATDRGNGLFGVDVSVNASNGNTYDATIIVQQKGKSFQVVDGEYFGFSAISYVTDDIQKRLDQNNQDEPNTPVMELDKQIMADSSFVQCL